MFFCNKTYQRNNLILQTIQSCCSKLELLLPPHAMLMDAVLLLFLFSPAFWPKLSIMDSTIKNCNSVQPSRIQTRTGESPNNEGTASHQLLSLPLEEQYIQAVLFSFSLLLHLTLQPSNSLLAINSLKNLRHIFSTRLFGDNYCFITAAQAHDIL